MSHPQRTTLVLVTKFWSLGTKSHVRYLKKAQPKVLKDASQRREHRSRYEKVKISYEIIGILQ